MKKLLEDEFVQFAVFIVTLIVIMLSWITIYDINKNSKDVEMAKAGLVQKVENNIVIWVKP